MSRTSLYLAFAALAGLPSLAAAEQAKPLPDIAAFIECRADFEEWSSLAFHRIAEPRAIEALGWRPRPSDNPFMQEYDLPAAIDVFGYATGWIALTATGPMAVIEGIMAPDLAARLDIEPIVTSPEKFLGEKVVHETRDEEDGIAYHTRISLNVANVDTHPGVTLVGCAYVLESSAAQ